MRLGPLRIQVESLLSLRTIGLAFTPTSVRQLDCLCQNLHLYLAKCLTKHARSLLSLAGDIRLNFFLPRIAEKWTTSASKMSYQRIRFSLSYQQGNIRPSLTSTYLLHTQTECSNSTGDSILYIIRRGHIMKSNTPRRVEDSSCSTEEKISNNSIDQERSKN